jgi:hypothetical protein
VKRLVLAGVAVAALGLAAVPASAESAACLNLDITVNGEASPANGEYCLPELPPPGE